MIALAIGISSVFFYNTTKEAKQKFLSFFIFKRHISMASKSVQQQSLTTINEPIKLTKKQNEILTMVCDLYEMKVGEYIKEVLIESLKEEITDGDFCGLLASKLEDNKKSDKNKAPDKVGSDSVSGFDNYHFLE